jgi:hypothetical protein
MAVFLISYDLRKPDYDYQPLYEALAKANAKHVQDSIWGLDTTSNSTEVFDYFWQFMHNAKDRLLVVPFEKANGYKSENAMTKLKDL